MSKLLKDGNVRNEYVNAHAALPVAAADAVRDFMGGSFYDEAYSHTREILLTEASGLFNSVGTWTVLNHGTYVQYRFIR